MKASYLRGAIELCETDEGGARYIEATIDRVTPGSLDEYDEVWSLRLSKLTPQALTEFGRTVAEQFEKHKVKQCRSRY